MTDLGDTAAADETMQVKHNDPEPDDKLRNLGGNGSRLAVWHPGMESEAAPASPEDTIAQEQRWQDEGIPAAADREPPHLTAGRSAVPRPLVSQRREVCDHCGGTGHMPGISDYLRESAALLGDREQADEVVRAFYRRLFVADPDLVKLFPGNPAEGDLGTDHKGAQQRDKLFGALVALADLFDPDEPEKMARLDTALQSFGRHHAAFARADGVVRGATLEEYAAVKDALFSTLVRTAGNAWKAEYTESWSQAYDYATAVMIAEQHRSGFALPRFPRA